MINKILFLFLFLFTSVCFGQKVEDLKVLNHFSVNNDAMHTEGYLAPYGQSINTHQNRIYYWFAGAQIHQTQGDFKDRLLNGTYTENYANKQLAKKGEFSNGLKTGEWLDWDENGILMMKSQYKKGWLNGYQFTFDSIGAPAQRVHFHKGMMQGLKQEYQQGNWKSVARYKKGETVPLKEPFLKRIIHAIFKKHPKKD